MPTVAPAWFQWQTYFDNKLAQCQANDPTGEWTEAKLEETFTRDGFTLDADGMYRHFQEYGNTPAENVSPNEYFDVAYYMAAKLAQCQADDPEGNWTPESLAQRFQDLDLSAWDHYTLYGQFEGLNPSAYFNTDKYMDAKLAQCENSDPSGEWTMDKLDDVFKADHINPIMHWDMWGKDENLGYEPSPLPEPPVVYTEELPLTPTVGEHMTGAAGENTLFTAVVSSDATLNTLNPTDTIDGGDSVNGLKVRMDTSFRGFKGVENEDGTVSPNVTNVQNVELVNNTANRGVTFNAQNISSDATNWTLDANGGRAVNVTGITASDANVTIKNLAQGDNQIAFNADSVKGSDNTLTLGLDNVGQVVRNAQQYVTVTGVEGIENLVVDTATASHVNLGKIAATTMTAEGAGNVFINAVNASVTSFDASNAVGNVDVNLSAAAAKGLSSIKGGHGDDTFTLGDNINNIAEFDGGEGYDTAVVGGTKQFNASPTWVNVENIRAVGATEISAQNISDLTTFTVATDANATLRALKQSEITVNDTAAGAGVITVSGEEVAAGNGQYNSLLGVVNYNVSSHGADTSNLKTNATDVVNVTIESEKGANGKEQVQFAGNVEANDTAELNVVAKSALINGSIFNAHDASLITVDAQGGVTALVTGPNSNAEVTLTSHGAITYDNTTSDFSGIADLTINQFGETFTGINQLDNAANVTINGQFGSDGTNVVLGTIGNANFDQMITVTANNLQDLTIAQILTKNQDIDFTVSNCNGDVTVTNGLDAGQTAASAGDINMTVQTNGNLVLKDAQAVFGDNLTISLAGVGGNVSGANNQTWFQGSTIEYTGAAGADNVGFNIMGPGSSTIYGGDGADTINVISYNNSAEEIAQLEINGGAGTDAFTFENKGTAKLGITLNGYETGESITVTGKSSDTTLADADVTAINDILGVPLSKADLTNVSAGVFSNGDDLYVLMGGTGAVTGVLLVTNVDDPAAVTIA